MKEKRERLEKQVLTSRKEIRTDRMDMSFGEIMNMYNVTTNRLCRKRSLYFE